MRPSLSRADELGRALTFGFATAVAMWCAWWVSHHPAIDASPAIAGPVVLAVMVIGMVLSGRSARSPLVAGGLSGLIAAGLSLLVLGALLARPPESGDAPLPGVEGFSAVAALRALGFLVAGTIIGAVGATVGRTVAPTSDVSDRPWLARFAVVACISVFPLILLGGAVTSTGSGMSVPGWPDSYGANMFLYPISLMSNPRVFLEHTHRLLGSLVGLTTLTLMLWTVCSSLPRAVKLWSVGAFALVCVQGVLGGLRVTQSATLLAFVHGVVSQIFLAVLVVIATRLSQTRELAARADTQPRDRGRRAFAMAFQHSTILQLLFGAAYRHFDHGKAASHALWSHAGFSLVVVAMAVACGFLLRSREGQAPINRPLRLLGGVVLGVVAFQFVLGWVTFMTVLSGGPKPDAPTAAQLTSAGDIPVARALIATVHQANGALVLALATIAVVITRALWKRAPAP